MSGCILLPAIGIKKHSGWHIFKEGGALRFRGGLEGFLKGTQPE
jgi:hypothetical protein